jgi:glutaredoxin
MPNVMLVTSYGCTPCLRVKRVLTELQAEMPTLTVEEVEYKSASGAKLSIENGIQYPPAVFVNGKLLAKGKIDAERMIKIIRENKEELKS